MNGKFDPKRFHPKRIVRGLVLRAGRRCGLYVGELPPSSDVPAVHLRQVIRTYGIGCVLDVGGHYGEFATLMRRDVGFEGRIVSFEPVPNSFRRLQAALGQDPAWAGYMMALGAEDGEVRMNVMNADALSSFALPSENGRAVVGAQPMVVEQTPLVEMRQLRSILPEATRGLPADAPLMLKMDTQGHDLEVLKGAAGALDRVVAVLSEVSVRPLYENVPTLPDTLATMSRLGFALSNTFPGTMDRGHRLTEMDCLFVRA